MKEIWSVTSRISWDVALPAALGALGVILALLLVRRLAAHRLRRLAARTATVWDDLLVFLLGKTRLFFILALGAYAGLYLLPLPPRAMNAARLFTLTAILLQAAVWGFAAIRFLVENYGRREDLDPATRTTVSAIGFLGRFLLITVLGLLLLENLGVDVTALITGLGIGGIAVALAVQNVLGDLLASLSIVLDKPFVIGDFIIIDEYMGVVEHVGLKTTRVRSISGEQLVFANSDLLTSRIRNYKRMHERRVVTTLGVTYDTPLEQLERIPEIVRSIFTALESARLDRVHFRSLGDSALIYEIVYYVLNPDYKVYIEVEQRLNLELIRRFRQEGIEFAYPTQTVVLQSAGPVPAPGDGASA